MSKTLGRIGGVFLGFGLVFGGVGACSVIADHDNVQNGARAEGTVVSLERRNNPDSGTTYHPVVEFGDSNGERHRFTSSFGSNPASFERGERVEVVYDPWKPEKAIIDSFATRFVFPLIFGAFGLVFGGIGGGLLFWAIRRRRIIARLKQTGLPISAKFSDCYRDKTTQINGRSPYRVVAQATHPATGKLASFKSEQIWLDLTDTLSGKKVKVLVDPATPKLHYVDLSDYVSDEDMA